MEFLNTPLEGVVLITPQIYEDERGSFSEIYQKEKFHDAGIDVEFVQDNHSHSRRGVLRGLHYQIKQPQGKLIQVTSGHIFDVAVDIRRNLPTFGKWYGNMLSAEKPQQLWLPPGIAHGFLVLSEYADVLYKTTNYYAPQWERCLLWNDPNVNVRWPEVSGVNLIISDKDRRGKLLDSIDIFD